MRSFIKNIRPLWIGFLLLQLAAVSLGQTIQSVDPADGSIVVPVTITGTGFGASKAKVTFENATLKKENNINNKILVGHFHCWIAPVGRRGNL